MKLSNIADAYTLHLARARANMPRLAKSGDSRTTQLFFFLPCGFAGSSFTCFHKHPCPASASCSRAFFHLLPVFCKPCTTCMTCWAHSAPSNACKPFPTMVLQSIARGYCTSTNLDLALPAAQQPGLARQRLYLGGWEGRVGVRGDSSRATHSYYGANELSLELLPCLHTGSAIPCTEARRCRRVLKII